MPILLGQVAVIVLMLTIGTFTNRLGGIRENRPEVGPQESTRRIGGSLGTKGHVMKGLPAPRGCKKSVTRLGVTRVTGKIDAVGETRHWGIDEAFQRHQRGEGARYEREALGLMMVTHDTHRRRMPIASFVKIALLSTRTGRTIKSTR